MIKFENIPQMIRNIKAVKLDIYDSQDNVLYNIDGSTPEDAIRQLETAKTWLQDYGRVWIRACTPQQKKSQAKYHALWEVLLVDKQSPVAPVQTAGITKHLEEMKNLELKFEKFKMEMEMQKFKDGLEEKYGKKNKLGFDPTPWIPIAGQLLGWDPTTVTKMMTMGTMANGNNTPNAGQPQALAGPPVTQTQPGNTLKLDMTPEEFTQKILDKLQTVDQKIGSENLLNILTWCDGQPELFKQFMLLGSKAGNENLLAMIQKLNSDPGTLQTALNLLK